MNEISRALHIKLHIRLLDDNEIIISGIIHLVIFNDRNFSSHRIIAESVQRKCVTAKISRIYILITIYQLVTGLRRLF